MKHLKYFESSEKCKHTNKKNLDSFKGNNWNSVEVECLDCGMRRNEKRFTNSKRIDTSKWHQPKK